MPMTDLAARLAELWPVRVMRLLNTLEQSHRLQTTVLVPGVRPADITAN